MQLHLHIAQLLSKIKLNTKTSQAIILPINQYEHIEDPTLYVSICIVDNTSTTEHSSSFLPQENCGANRYAQNEYEYEYIQIR